MNARSETSRILLVDDDDTFRSVMANELSRRGYAVEAVSTGQAAVDRFAVVDPHVVLLDLRLPDLDGIEVLERLRQLDSHAGVVLLTGHGTIDTAIQAIRLGAYDYLEKPCPIEKVEMTIKKIREHLGLLARHKVLQDGFSPPDVRARMVGKSPAFQQVCQTVVRVARTDATTLILGETGVGKDMVAKLVHTESPRRDAPFVVVDCAALHEDLLQSELFGHEKGAFSGAARRKHGLFEVAHTGTLFLDEIGDTSPETQANLLRVLETGRFRRLGGTAEIAVDVRIVSATNRDLDRAIEQGSFREDLFFRLSALTVEIPPLRERSEDIPLLIDHFVERLNRRFARSSHLSEEARRVLLHHDWPGNVRELIHVLEQGMVLSEGEVIDVVDLPRIVRGNSYLHPGEKGPRGAAQGDLPSLSEVEREHVLAVLERADGNRARAAQILRISERTLYRLIKKYGSEHLMPGPAKGRSAP